MKFLAKIMELRTTEAGWLKKYVYTLAMTSFVFWGAPTFVSVVTFGSCMLMGIPLELGKILSALAMFRILQEPIYYLPDTISMVVQTKVSLNRIASFLHLDDLQPDVIEMLPREFLPAADLILVMKDGRITQVGKYNVILNSGTDFMELVGAHEKALSALDSTMAGPVFGSISKEAGNLASTNGVVQNQEDKYIQNGRADNLIGSNGQLIQEEEREKEAIIG
nr:isoform 2 of abc transporter c family member 3 [Quercus suber]